MNDPWSFFPFERTTLPVGVVIPTYNCADRLPEHIQNMSEWLSQAEEVVVVDSFSTDGTFEILSKQLKHSRLRIHQRPRGLYECWNYGIRQINAEYTYISTIGDHLIPEGLLWLVSGAIAHPSDVVISPPLFQAEDGSHVKGKTWPVHGAVRRDSAKKTGNMRTVKSWEAFISSATEAPKGLLGSSAANLYRTKFLQGRPFPTTYGHFGDTAWAIQHAFDTRWTLLALEVSTFTLHDSGVMMEWHELESMRRRLFDLARKTLPKGLCQNSRKSAIESGYEEFVAEFGRTRAAEEDCNTARRAHRPWPLSLKAWAARVRRNRARARVRALRRALFREAQKLDSAGAD
jgi:glycosyltransferase involved in cell wall biosynthesis